MSRLNELQQQAWFQVLSDKVKEASIAEVARQLGYSRTTVSLVLSGKYDGGTDAFSLKVMETFTDQVQCPFLNTEINRGTCRDYHTRPMPTSRPADLSHWMACRDACPHNTQLCEEFDLA